ncbi:hypothetical protein KRMM14A1004_38470 [Krasilnikovia sp. MM14-A1004]
MLRWRAPLTASEDDFLARLATPPRSGAHGFAHAMLGDEPNLYGHLTQPGLLVFKADSGFIAVPSQDFDHRLPETVGRQR